jgi:hypothetical protein
MSLAADIWAPRVQTASDCLSVVRSYQEGTKGAYAHIVEEMKSRSREFQEFSIVSEHRSVNQEAHNLARFAIIASLVV